MINLNVSRFDNLDKARRHYLARIDALAEEARGELPGKVAAHEAKYQEAMRWPDGEFPFLKREAQATSMPIDRLVSAVKLARQRWEKRDAEIEAVRVSSRRKIKGARDTVAMEEIAQRTLVTLDGIGSSS